MKKFIILLLKPIAGKKVFQPFFENLLLAVFYCMNFGAGSFVDESGESKVLDYIFKRKKEKKTIIFDVGANVGDYAKEIINYFKNDAIIHCFEPSKFTYNTLVKNIGDSNNVYLNNIGLGSIESEMTLFTNEASSVIASLYQRKLEHINVEMNLSETVQILTIDKYCKQNEIEKIDFLKIDVEGHEISVLQGANQMISKGAIHAIQFEFGGCNLDSRTFFKDFYLLLSPNYNVYRVVKNGLYPISVYKEEYEIFYTVNYYAELKSAN
jgi:FkbM family methyltransferase